jgi:hypothetical protein
MTEPSYEVVWEAENELEANICQAVLADAGITAIIHTEGEAWRRLYLGEPLGPKAQVLVPSTDADRARTILAEYQQQVEVGAFEPEDDDQS